MAETTLMQEKVFVNPDHSSQVLYQLSELWRDKKLCDATLEVGPVKVYVHRLVLLAACPYLLTIGGQQDVPMLEVRLPLSVGLEGLNVFLTYLYDGVLNLTTNNLLSVEKLSNVMNVAGIQKFCEEFRDMDQSVRDSVGPPEIESFDHNVRLKDNSIQIIFGESQSDLKQDILQENESENDCKRRKMNIETLSPILQQTSSVIRKKRSPNRKIKLKISKSPKGIRSSSTEIKHLESDLNESNVRIKQEPGSYSDDDGDTESFDDPGHTDFVRQAPYSTQALASSDEETETRHSRDITQQQTGQPEVDATRVLQNVVKNMPEVAMGLDTASEIDDDNQPRMFMTLNESSRSPSKKSSKTKHTVSTPSGSSKNKALAIAKLAGACPGKELAKHLDLFLKQLKQTSADKGKKNKQHISRRKEQVCKTCGKHFFTVGGYLRHRDIHICSTSKCRICFQRFSSKEDIEKHMITHLENKMFSCSKCSSTFAYRTSLQRHERRCIDQALCICSICGQTFVSKDNLADHMKGKHEKGDGYQCPECGMFFRWRSSLSKHNKKQHSKAAANQSIEQNLPVVNYDVMVHTE